MSEAKGDPLEQKAPSKALTLNWDGGAKHVHRLTPEAEGGSQAVTVNWDPVAKHSWEWRPPGPETEKLRKLIKRRLPEQRQPSDEDA